MMPIVCSALVALEEGVAFEFKAQGFDADPVCVREQVAWEIVMRLQFENPDLGVPEAISSAILDPALRESTADRVVKHC